MEDLNNSLAEDTNPVQRRPRIAVIAIVLGILSGVAAILVSGLALLVSFIGIGFANVRGDSTDSLIGIMGWAGAGIGLGIAWLAWAKWSIGASGFFRPLACILLAASSIAWGEFARGDIAMITRSVGAVALVLALFWWLRLPR